MLISYCTSPTKTPLYGQVTHEKLVKAEPPKKGVNLIVGIWAEKIKPIYIYYPPLKILTFIDKIIPYYIHMSKNNGNIFVYISSCLRCPVSFVNHAIEILAKIFNTLKQFLNIQRTSTFWCLISFNKFYLFGAHLRTWVYQNPGSR